MSFGADEPRIVTPPPGPRSRSLSLQLERYEAPGINTLPFDPSAPSNLSEKGGGQPASLVWDEACGANVRDVDGNVFVDLTSGFGVAAVGHRHPRVVAAIREQSERLLHGLGDVHAHPLRIELARRLADLSPFPPERSPQVFFAVSGAEAVEIALKTALAATSRRGIVAFTPSYHGMTLGALALTSRPEFRRPFLEHLDPHVRHFPYGEVGPELGAHLHSGEVAAVLVEPIVGREGVIFPPPGWLSALRRLCTESGTLLIADEIFTGFGRTGRLFAVEQEAVVPDLLCCGKALGGGLPISAVLAPRELFRVWQTPGEALHTATFVANPLACAAALAVLEILYTEGLTERAARLGRSLEGRLAAWPAHYSRSVAEVRSRGLLAGVVFPSAPIAKAFAGRALLRGVLLLAGGPEGRAVQLVPPLTIPEPLLASTLSILEEVLEEDLF